ncbi:hypothetical protein FEM48_Zijuj10G0012400 [Ziziphus jujuba var. spinosa]|uniref:DC1 domain-containing protein n=1 Tax=Ziziphus jujuba var. spinosa TaxID=714518 RepID=A0A978UKF1_ZIZJJ|nr:hypothetical protein FEM48_Zijuj10G0012400 [Ziziphus jujuba var. spinosa]
MCYVCDDFCETDLYRCFDCNFNIHKACASFPLDIADYDQHVQPFALMVYTWWTEDTHASLTVEYEDKEHGRNGDTAAVHRTRGKCDRKQDEIEDSNAEAEYSAAYQGCGGDILSRELLCKCLRSFECHDHALSWAYKDDNGRPVDIKCHGCGRYMPNENYFYYCRKMIVSIT